MKDQTRLFSKEGSNLVGSSQNDQPKSKEAMRVVERIVIKEWNTLCIQNTGRTESGLTNVMDSVWTCKWHGNSIDDLQ